VKTGVENGIFRSEIGSGVGDTGGTPPPKISASTPPPPRNQVKFVCLVLLAVSEEKHDNENIQ